MGFLGKATGIILKGRSGSCLPRELCADARCRSGRQRQRQSDAVPPSDHTQRGCSAPLRRYRRDDDDQDPHLSRAVGTHQGGRARTDRQPKKTGRADRRELRSAADLRVPHEQDFCVCLSILFMSTCHHRAEMPTMWDRTGWRRPWAKDRQVGDPAEMRGRWLTSRRDGCAFCGGAAHL